MPLPVPPVAELRRLVQKPPQFQTSAFSRWFTRRVSVRVTWLALHTPITANQMTVLQLIVGIAGTAVLGFVGKPWSLAAVILLQSGYVLDCADGEVARYRNQASVRGVFFDYFTHAVVNPLIFLSYALYVYGTYSYGWVLTAGAVAAIFALIPSKLALHGTIVNVLTRRSIPQYALAMPETSNNAAPLPWFEYADQKLSHRYTVASFAKGVLEYPGIMNVVSVLVIMDVIAPLPLWVHGCVLIGYALSQAVKEFTFFWYTARTPKLAMMLRAIVDQGAALRNEGVSRQKKDQ